MTIKDFKYVKINGVNSVYLIFGKVNGYFEEINENKYLMLAPSNESKEKHEELYNKIRDLTNLITENSNDYDEKWTKIKF